MLNRDVRARIKARREHKPQTTGESNCAGRRLDSTITRAAIIVLFFVLVLFYGAASITCICYLRHWSL